MLSVSWHGPGGYDRFVRVDEQEMQVIVNYYGKPEAAAWGGSDGFHYYLICDKARILTPLRIPSLAFGGQWNGDSPYGQKADCHFSLDTLPEYRLEPDWQSPK